MAWFAMPKNAIRGDYAVVSPQDVAAKNLVPDSVWKVSFPVGGSADILLVDGPGLEVKSNNPNVIKNPIPETSSGNIRTLSLSGTVVGFSIIDVIASRGNGSLPLQVEVMAAQAPTTVGSAIILEEPSMALNAHDTPATYAMQHTYTISPNTTAQEIIDLIKRAGKLKHLAISCHAYVDRQTGATRLDLGKGFDHNNIDLFGQLENSIGVFWQGGCASCGSQEGRNDSKARGMKAKCYVVGPSMYMANPPGTKGKLHLPKSAMDMHDRFKPIVFTPAGDTITWATFLGLSSRLGFKV